MRSRKDKISLSTLGRYRQLSRLDKYERELLAGWEGVHKKSQLTLWILLALKHGPKHMEQIKKFIESYTNSTLTADEKSIYRALRRFERASLVDHVLKPSKSGPGLKLHHLTVTGRIVLGFFVQRNIVTIFYNQSVKELVQ